MGSTMYRRRGTGRGRRVAGKRRDTGFTSPERRRLRQLAASLVIFLLVLLGRGVMPGQAEALGRWLAADTDLSGVGAWLEQAVFGEGQSREEGESGEASAPEGDGPAGLPDAWDRLGAPGFALWHGDWPDVPAQTEAGTEGPAVVTAVAQMYDDQGQELPEGVSLAFYELGLEETALPVMGSITSGFGFRDHPVSGEYSFHTAVDIGTDCGTEVLAFADGTVRYIGENGVYGLYLKLDHSNGVSTFYAHCEELLVEKGDTVKCGQVIALSGETGNATGPHLHFSLEKDGIRLDPAWYLEL